MAFFPAHIDPVTTSKPRSRKAQGCMKTVWTLVLRVVAVGLLSKFGQKSRAHVDGLVGIQIMIESFLFSVVLNKAIGLIPKLPELRFIAGNGWVDGQLFLSC